MSARPVRIALAAALCAALLGCQSRGGWPMAPGSQAPDVILRGAAGSSVSLARTGGRVSIVAFGYTSCPDVCPTTLSDWHRLRTRLGRDAEHVRFVFVSADWRHDTPEGVAAYAQRFDASFIGLALDSARQREVLGPFKAEATYSKGPDGRALAFSHTDYTYLVDAHGRILTAYEFASGLSGVERDVRTAVAAAAAGR